MKLNKPKVNLPYPKFLETASAQIYDKDKLLWQGLCFFTKKTKFNNLKDGYSDEIIAKARISEIEELKDKIDINFEIIIEQKNYIIKSVIDNKNHYALELIAGAYD